MPGHLCPRVDLNRVEARGELAGLRTELLLEYISEAVGRIG